MEIRGQSFSVLAEVTVDTTGAEGVIFKQGGAHGGHVLFIQDGRLHYVYNFMGEEEQKVSSVRRGADGQARLRRPLRTRRDRRGQPHPAGEATLFIDDAAVGSLADMKVHPGTFGLAGAGLSRRAQQRIGGFAFVQGAVCVLRRHDPQVVVDVSGKPYEDVEKELALAFAKD